VPLDNGDVVPAGKLYFYLTGTSTPANVYTTPALDVAHSNPVEADSEGVFPPIYLDSSNGQYRVKLTDSSGVQIWQVDTVPSENSTSQSYTVTGDAPYIDLIETGVTANEGGWRIRVNGEELSIALMNDAKSVFTNVLRVSNRSGTTSADVTLANLLVSGAAEFDGTAQFDGAVTNVPSISSGSFTPTWAGFSSAPTGNISWQKITGPVGSLVMLFFGATSTGTSNATDMSLTSLPSTIRPLTDSATRYPCVLVDNGARIQGSFGFGTPAGTLNFAADTNYSGFTAASSKGVPPLTALIYGI
jgi:hypothetical protein